jgi:hypothetical protein
MVNGETIISRVRGRAWSTPAAVLCALFLFGAANPPAAPAASAPDAAQLKKRAVKKTAKAVKRKLPAERMVGLMPAERPVKVKVTSCKQRLAHNRLKGFTCAWNAHGELPGRVLLRSNGKAKVDAQARRARVGPVRNLTEVQAPLLATPHDVSFGYFEDFTKVRGLYDDASPAATGSDIIREGITWKVLQPIEGSDPASWEWDDFDQFYARAMAAGLRPILTFRNAPCWAALPPCVENAPNPPDPTHYDEYAFAAAQIAARYPQAYAIELFFEPNNENMWGRPPDPVAFSTAVGQAADAVHAVAGDTIRVYAGGLAPGMASSDKYYYGDFISDALDAGGIQHADAVAFHAVTEVPYQPGMDPTESYLGRLRIQTEALRSALAAHGVSMPIAFTQLSYSTGAATYPYSEDQQGEALAASYDLIRSLPDTESVIVSRLFDDGDGSKVSGFGVLRADGTPKPAYCELAQARGIASPPGC